MNYTGQRICKLVSSFYSSQRSEKTDSLDNINTQRVIHNFTEHFGNEMKANELFKTSFFRFFRILLQTNDGVTLAG